MLMRKHFKGKMQSSGCVPGLNCQGDIHNRELMRQLRHIGKAGGSGHLSQLRQLGKLAGGLSDAKRLVGKQGGEWKSLASRTLR